MQTARQRKAAAESTQAYARTSAVLGRQYRTFFGAAIAATLLLQVTIVTDTILVGQLLGPVPMSGVRVASPIVNLLNVFGMLVGVGSSTLVAIAIGRRDRVDANNAFTLGVVLSVLVGLVCAIAVAPNAELIASLMSSDDSTVGYTATFLRIVMLASPVYILTSAMALLLRSDSCIKLSSVVLAMAGVANVGFDLLFMGALGMGVEGAALATDMGMLVAVVLSLLYFRWPDRTLRLTNLGNCIKGTLIAGIVNNGAPSAMRMLFACISLLFLNYVVGSTVGVMGIAFFTVCGNIQLLVVAFFSAGGQAAIPMEGVLFGEGDYRGLRLLVAYVFRIVIVCVVVLTIAIALFPAQIVSLFVPGGIDGADWLLRLYAIGFVPLAINYVLTYFYNTIQRRTIAMTLTLCENLVLYLPFIWIFTNAFGLVGTVLAFVAAELLALCLGLGLAVWTSRAEGLRDVLLIPDVAREVTFEATVPVSNADAASIAREVKGALDVCGVDPGIAMQAAIGVEEMVAHATTCNQDARHDVHFDVIVSNLPESVQVSLRDNGEPFDPTTASSEEREDAEGNKKDTTAPDCESKSFEPDTYDGIAVMRSIATKVVYRYTLGLNHTVIEVAKGCSTQHSN